MYRLMLVEDEEIICHGLKNKIPWKEVGFEVVGEANDGETALRMIPELWPDAILTDIRMPGLDGIGFIEKLRELGSKAEVVVLSGFDDFEYARKCIAFGVTEYLLKPIKNDVILSTFYQLKCKLDSRYSKDSEFNNIKKKIELTIPVAKGKIIQDILENRLNKEDTDRIHAILDMPFDKTASFGVAVFHISRLMNTKITFDDGSRDCFQRVLENETARLPQYQLLSVLFQKDTYTIVAVWSVHRRQKEDTGRDLCNAIREKLENLPAYTGKILVSVGVGSIFDNIFGLSRSYIQAKNALMQKFYIGLGKVISYTETQNEPGRTKVQLLDKTIDSNQLVRKIIEYIVSGDMISSEKSVKCYCDTYLGMRRYNPEILFMRVIELVLKLAGALEEQGISFTDVYGEGVDQEIRFLVEEKTIDELREWLIMLANRLIKQSERTEDTYSIDHMIEVVKQYVQKNYNRKITSKELCDIAMVSPSYFSSMFKQKTGYTLMEYVIMVRIQKAKELLAKSDYKIYEVATVVGYDDFRHFSKQFKKLEHISPSKFRKDNEEKLLNRNRL